MMPYAYTFSSMTYLVLPVVALGVAGTMVRRRSLKAVRTFLRACLVGTVLGGALAVIYRSAAGAQLPVGQIVFTCYFATAAVLAVLALNWLISQGVSRLLRIHPVTGGGCCPGAQIAAGVLQAVLLVAISFPYLGSVLLLYRPKAPTAGDPLTLIDARFQTVRFRAVDRTPLEAWWIPATRNSRTDGRGSVRWGRDTVLLCPGFRADKAKDLFLAADLVANGYNVLAIDLRAHGRSGGHLTGFGAAEARDVLAAVGWLRRHHPSQSRRILGLGESLGAVALIEAAAQDSPEGRAIDAIAAYDPYDDLATVAAAMAEQYRLHFGRWLFNNAVLPIASAQIGANLRTLSPARAVRSLWPRPILVLANPMSRDPVNSRGFEVFQQAFQPRYSYFRENLDHEGLLHDRTAALTVRIFFDGERQMI